MKDLQAYYLKSAKEALLSLTRLVDELSESPVEIQTIRNACTQAQQVTSDLNRMCGVAEGKSPTKRIDPAALAAATAIETKAIEIYNSWNSKPGWTPWVKGGNSIMQEKARDEATERLTKK